MKVELLFVPDCPNRARTLQVLREVIVDAGLDYDVEQIEIGSAAEAATWDFVGSPSVRVDGVDIDPDAPAVSRGALGCRLYAGNGVPPREMIWAAIFPHSRESD